MDEAGLLARPRALPQVPRARKVIGLALAVVAQGAWLFLLRLDAVPPDKHTQGPHRLSLRLIPATAVPAPPLPGRTRPRLRDTTPPPRAALPAPDPAFQVPASTLSPAVLPPAPAMAATGPRTSATPLPLNLSLPAPRAASAPRAESMLGQVLNDPRANSSSTRTIAYAVADAAGTLPVVNQTSTDGTDSKLIRQGSKCTRVREFRGKTLDPMNESLKGATALVGKCVND